MVILQSEDDQRRMCNTKSGILNAHGKVKAHTAGETRVSEKRGSLGIYDVLPSWGWMLIITSATKELRLASKAALVAVGSSHPRIL